MTDTYTLTVTQHQLGIIRDACELLARCRMGQIADACYEVIDAEGKHVIDYQTARQAEGLVKAAVGLNSNASWGVGKHSSIDNAFDLYQTIRHRIAWDNAYADGILKPGERRKWDSMMGVSYDAPMKHGTEPLPVINGQAPNISEVM
jgi:hypothetical protein